MMSKKFNQKKKKRKTNMLNLGWFGSICQLIWEVLQIRLKSESPSRVRQKVPGRLFQNRLIKSI